MDADERHYLKELKRVDTLINNNNDRHSTLDPPIDRDNIIREIKYDNDYYPKKDEPWESYIKTLAVHVKMSAKKNIKCHITGVKQWYTHRNPAGCFMCEDMNLYYTMLDIMEKMAKAHPKDVF